MRSAGPAVPVLGARLSLWRAVIAFRVAALLVCLYLILRWHHLYQHPARAYAVGAAMIAGDRGRSAFLAGPAGRTGRRWWSPTCWPRRCSPWPPGAVQTAGPAARQHAHPDHDLGDRAGGGCGIVAGLLAGTLAALVQLAAAIAVRDGWDGRTLDSAVLLLGAGSLTGYLGRLVYRAELQTRAAAAVQAATAERQRLARSVHDGALQVLALVHRDGLAAGGRWAELGAAAAEQEAALRRLIAAEAAAGPARPGR